MFRLTGATTLLASVALLLRRAAAALLVIFLGFASAPPDATAFGGLSDEAVTVWQHRDSPTTTGWDIWYSVLGRATPTSTLTWHAVGGPVTQAAPIATLPGDDKNPHVGTNAGVTIAVWQHAPLTGSSPGDWDIFFSLLNTTTGTWSTPAPVAVLAGDDYDPNVAVDSNGNAIAVWAHRGPLGTREMFFSIFTSATGTWTLPAPVGVSGGQASLPEVTITSVASAGGLLAHQAVAAWSDVPVTAAPDHRMVYSTFNGLTWTAPVEIESAATGIGLSIANVGFANYVGTDPDPFGAFGRLGVSADASGNAYVVWGGGPELLGFFSPGVVGAILNVAANTWSPMLTPSGDRFVGAGGCENPDNALTTGGGDFVGVFDFAALIEHTFRTGGTFTVETVSYNSVFNDQRPSNAAISATEMIAVNWGAPQGPDSEIIWSVGTVTPGVSVSFGAAQQLVPTTLGGEDMFPEIASGFAASIITGGLTLSPPTATNPVGTPHTVTATATTNGNPAAGVLVNFTVTGSNGSTPTPSTGSCVTGTNGQCSFTYTSPTAGNDAITATATIAGQSTTATATKIWQGAAPKVQGRMTGGGSVINGPSDIPPGVRVTHGFELHCDVTKGPNNLQVNWDKGNRFHLETLTSAMCTQDNSIGGPNPPAAGFNKYVGSGTGRVNGVSGKTITFEFTDAGEPGKNDHVHIHISDPTTSMTILSADGFLRHGNHQAHAQ